MNEERFIEIDLVKKRNNNNNLYNELYLRKGD